MGQVGVGDAAEAIAQSGGGRLGAPHQDLGVPDRAAAEQLAPPRLIVGLEMDEDAALARRVYGQLHDRRTRRARASAAASVAAILAVVGWRADD